MDEPDHPAIRVAGIDCLDRLEPLWRALHAHHQQVAPGYAYQTDDVSWPLRRALYQQILAAGQGFVLLAERGDRLCTPQMTMSRFVVLSAQLSDLLA